MKPETRFKIRALEDLRSLDCSWWVKIQQLSILGTPDIIGLRNGRFVALELKAQEVDQPTTLQRHNLRLIGKAGGLTYTAHPGNWKQVFMELQEATQAVSA